MAKSSNSETEEELVDRKRTKSLPKRRKFRSFSFGKFGKKPVIIGIAFCCLGNP